MKKIILSSIFVFLLVVSPLQVKASTIIMETQSNRVLYEDNIHERRLTASIAKIMTAMVAINSGKLDETVTVNDSILKSYGSGIYIEIGEKIKLRDLVTGLLMRSGNDAAIMIADFVSGDQKKFADEMNSLATKIGMKNSTFNNPSGLDQETENHSTAYDMALLSSYAIKNKEYRSITGLKNKVVKTNKKTYEWKNKNKLLFQYEYAIGGKTGFTEKARRTLVTNAEKDGLSLTVVTFNDPNDFSNHKKLYEKYFKKYKSYVLLNKDNFNIVDDKFYDKKLYIKESFTYPLTKTEKDKIKIVVELNNNPKNNIAGKALVYLKDKLIHEQIIYYEEKPKQSSILSKIKKWFTNDK